MVPASAFSWEVYDPSRLDQFFVLCNKHLADANLPKFTSFNICLGVPWKGVAKHQGNALSHHTDFVHRIHKGVCRRFEKIAVSVRNHSEIPIRLAQHLCWQAETIANLLNVRLLLRFIAQDCPYRLNRNMSVNQSFGLITFKFRGIVRISLEISCLQLRPVYTIKLSQIIVELGRLKKRVTVSEDETNSNLVDLTER